MSRWLRIDEDCINHPAILKLSPRQRWRALIGVLTGSETAMTPFLRIGRADNRLPSGEWAELRSFIFKRDNYTCTYCQSSGGRLECDHILPLARGGSNELDNLTTACQPCNRSKHTKLLGDWLQ